MLLNNKQEHISKRICKFLQPQFLRPFQSMLQIAGAVTAYFVTMVHLHGALITVDGVSPVSRNDCIIKQLSVM
jgi:hypothetical protein